MQSFESSSHCSSLYEQVDGAFFRDYYDIVKYPMYFKKMEEKIKKGKYQNLQDVSKDVKLIIDNCFLYNGPGEISEVQETLANIVMYQLMYDYLS